MAGVGRRRRSLVALLCVWLLSAQLAGPQPVSSARGALQREGRWLCYEGKPVYLLGVDQQQMAAQKDVDYAAKLDILRAAGMNKIRIWGSNYFMAPDQALQPVAYRDGRFDLDAWDERYWSRIRDFAQQAKERSIIVEYTLFANYADAEVWSGKYSAGMFWNRDRNRNGAFSANPGGSLIPEFFHTGVGGLPRYAEETTSGHDLAYYQGRLADRAVDELAPYGNVYFEVFNEWPGKRDLWQDVYPWQQGFADRVHARGGIVTVNVAQPPAREALPGYWDRPSVDVLGFHTYARTPRLVSDVWRSAQDKGKVLQCNESWSYLAEGVPTVVREAWAHFLCGAYYGFYLDSPGQIGSQDGWQGIAAAAKAIRRVADTVPFHEMSPVDEAGSDYASLVTQGPGDGWLVLCKPGEQYVVYFWGTPSATDVHVRLPAGRYRCRWIAARAGRELLEREVDGADDAVIPAPAADWDGDYGVVLVVARV